MSADEERAAYIAGMRHLMDVLEANPDLPLPYQGNRTSLAFNDFLNSEDPRAALAETARLLPCEWDKRFWGDEASPTSSYFSLNGKIAGLRVELVSYRNAVCRKVVTGTREVTEKVKDPDKLAEVPEVEVTRVVEDFTWDCGTLLGPAPADTAATA